MALIERITELEARAAELHEIVAAATAELAGIRSELEVLRSGSHAATDLAELSRTDAIVAVLRQQGSAMSPNEIEARLADGGLTISRNKTTATLAYLMKQSRVLRVSRGRYVAT